MDFKALQPLGWKSFFQHQIAPDDWQSMVPLRVAEVHRSQLRTLGAQGPAVVEFPHHERWSQSVTVGDWVLARREGTQLYLARVLERLNGIHRKAAGSEIGEQWISANLDTAFIVMGCDSNFNLNRLERYLALVLDTRIEPVVILSKADTCDAIESLLASVPQACLSYAVDARDPQSTAILLRHLGEGQSITLMGSSGVGKTTLINTLLGEDRLATQEVREDDDRGRHTTTSRQLIQLPTGGVIIDTPGMRELQLPGVEEGLERLYGDIEALARECRFRDCRHNAEAGCRIHEALDSGALEQRRWKNYRKMQREQAFHDRELKSHHEVSAQRKDFLRRVRQVSRFKQNIRNTSYRKT